MNCSFDLIVKNAYRTFGKFEVLKWIKKVRCEVLKFFIDLHKEIHKEIQRQPSILNTDGGRLQPLSEALSVPSRI
jgi:hypothetical protein